VSFELRIGSPFLSNEDSSINWLVYLPEKMTKRFYQKPLNISTQMSHRLRGGTIVWLYSTRLYPSK
jgi:hypothetical protein